MAVALSPLKSILRHTTNTMPALVRTRTPSPNTLATHIPDLKVVGFPHSPVTSISRPLEAAELWPLYHFETHALACHACHKPYEVHRAGERLCSTGHTLAQDVTSLVFSSGNGKHIWSASATETSDHMVRVELPEGYVHVHSLLRAIERSQRHPRQRPIVSFNKSHRSNLREPREERYHTKVHNRGRNHDVQVTLPRREQPQQPSRKLAHEVAGEHSHTVRRTPIIVNWPTHAIHESPVPTSDRVPDLVFDEPVTYTSASSATKIQRRQSINEGAYHTDERRPSRRHVRHSGFWA